MRYKWIICCLCLLLFVSSLSCASGHQEQFSGTEPLAREISSLENRITETVSSSEQLVMDTIGEVSYGVYRAPIWVISLDSHPEPEAYRVLICGGVHGNEPAGVEIMVQMIEALAENPETYKGIAFDIIPLVNPWGWSHDIRFNREGLDVNRDFSSFNSQESVIIRGFIADKQYDLIIDCHEDPDASGFYLYQYANPDQQLSRKIIEAVKKLDFPVEQDVNMIILRTEDGLIDAPMWGLWFMKLTGQLSITNYFRLNNSKLVYTVETPTNQPFEKRLAIQKLALDLLLDSLYDTAE